MIIWPERPLCHGENPRWSQDGVSWRPEEPTPSRVDYPYGFPFRTCSYCGSIHPEDLLMHLKLGATMHGSDWKYGWPHKQYLEGIKNPNAGNFYPQYGYGGTLEEWVKRFPNAKQIEGEDRKFYLYDSEAPATTHAKWYNVHLKDLEPEAFKLVADELFKKAHILFQMNDGKLQYSAPYAGYQATSS
jgi:hypothetical protein